MKRFIKYIVSSCLIAVAINIQAQDSLRLEAKDTTHIVSPNTLVGENQDSTLLEKKENHFVIYLGTDYGKLISTAAQFDTKYEFNLAVQFSKSIRVTADYGYGKLDPPNAIQNGTYTSSGNYYRVGLDYMFNIAPKTYLSLGGMYAISNFKDEGTVMIQSEVWPSFNERFERDNFTASWAEFVITSEAPIFNRNEGIMSRFYWGIKFRFRFLIDRTQPENFDVYAIPGYGRTWNDLVPAANLFITYKF